jgi:hypothetical protein
MTVQNNKLRHLLTFSFTSLLLTLSPFTLAKELPWLYTQGNEIKQEDGKTVVLKGVSLPDLEHLNVKSKERHGMKTKALIKKAVHDFHAKVIRIPILPESEDNKTGFFKNMDRYYYKYLKPAIELCQKLGVYVIIDLHYVDDFLEKREKAFLFWQYMTPKLKRYSHVIFEIFNEPTTPYSWDKWATKMAQPLVNMIRNMGAVNLIIVGGPEWNNLMLGALDRPIKGRNIVYALHIYPNIWERKDWDKNYLPLIRRYPVFMTEWGYGNSRFDFKLQGDSKGYGKALTSWMDRYSMSWTVWCFDNVWAPALFNSDWSITNEQEGMGTFVKDLLLKNHKQHQR